MLQPAQQSIAPIEMHASVARSPRVERELFAPPTPDRTERLARTIYFPVGTVTTGRLVATSDACRENRYVSNASVRLAVQSDFEM